MAVKLAIIFTMFLNLRIFIIVRIVVREEGMVDNQTLTLFLTYKNYDIQNLKNTLTPPIFTASLLTKRKNYPN